MADGEDENVIFEKMSIDYQLSREDFDRYYLDFVSVLKSSQLLD